METPGAESVSTVEQKSISEAKPSKSEESTTPSVEAVGSTTRETLVGVLMETFLNQASEEEEISPIEIVEFIAKIGIAYFIVQHKKLSKLEDDVAYLLYRQGVTGVPIGHPLSWH